MLIAQQFSNILQQSQLTLIFCEKASRAQRHERAVASNASHVTYIAARTTHAAYAYQYVRWSFLLAYLNNIIAHLRERI